MAQFTGPLHLAFRMPDAMGRDYVSRCIAHPRITAHLVSSETIGTRAHRIARLLDDNDRHVGWVAWVEEGLYLCGEMFTFFRESKIDLPYVLELQQKWVAAERVALARMDLEFEAVTVARAREMGLG